MTTTTDRRIVEIDVRTARSMQESITRASSLIGGLEDKLGSLKSMVAEFGAGLIAGLSLGSFVSAIKATIDSFEKMGERASAIGTTTEFLSGLTYQAKQAGVAAEELDVGLIKAQRALVDLGKETTSATKALTKLGVVAGTDLETALGIIADEFERMGPTAERTALAVEIFGKSGAKFIPMLEEGAEGLKKWREEAERLGAIITGDAAAAAAEFNDEIGALNQGLAGMIAQITVGLLPSLLQITNAFKGATESGTSFKQTGETLGSFLKTLTATAINIGTAFEVLSTIIGGVAASLLMVSRGEFRLAIQVAKEAGLAVAQLDKENAERLARLMAPVAVTPRLAPGGGGGAGAALAGLTENEKSLAAFTAHANAELVKQIELVMKLDADAGIAANKERERREKRVAELTGQTAAKQFADDLAILDEAFFDLGMSIEDYDRGLAAITKANKKVGDSNEELLTSMQQLGKEIQASVEGWSSAAADAVLDFVTGVDVSLSKMVENVARQFAKMALQKLVFDQLFSSASTAIGNAFKPQATGGAFGRGGALAFASGGVVSSPTTFAFAGGAGIMGEAGPEAILPLKRNAQGDLGVTASGGGAVTVNVINQAGAQVDVATSQGPNGEREVEVFIQRAVSDGFARGRFDSVLGSTYGINRRGR